MPNDPLAAALPEALAHWQDPVLLALAAETPLEHHQATDTNPFVSLCRSIVHQQVSMAAATTIFARLQNTLGTIAPERVLEAPLEQLRGAGLSQSKCAYLVDLSERVLAGLDLRFQDATDEEVVRALTEVKGIGPWSAKMFLMFHLGRLDVCPWEDLGIRLAVAQFYGVPEPEAGKWLQTKQVEWSPYNSVAARILWRARRLQA